MVDVAEDKASSIVFHAIQRTSPKGGRFLGTCILCGAENLPMSAISLPCPNTSGKTWEEAVIELTSGNETIVATEPVSDLTDRAMVSGTSAGAVAIKPLQWKLVPVEPTEAMIEAHELACGGDADEASPARIRECWRDMLIAAPPAKIDEGFGVDEYAHVAALIREHLNNDAQFRAVMSNNFNVILAALDRSALVVSPPAPPEAGELIDAITPGNFAHEREVGDVYGWCERIRKKLAARIEADATAMEELKRERDEWKGRWQTKADAYEVQEQSIAILHRQLDSYDRTATALAALERRVAELTAVCGIYAGGMDDAKSALAAAEAELAKMQTLRKALQVAENCLKTRNLSGARGVIQAALAPAQDDKE